MDRKEAERSYDAGKEVVIEKLLAIDARIRELESYRRPDQKLVQLLPTAIVRPARN